MVTLLEVSGLKAFYGQTQALYDVAFALEQGGITTLLGANGAGKTTTLRAICNMVRTEGRITYDGQPITGRATESIVQKPVDTSGRLQPLIASADPFETRFPKIV